jgi:hypothetical protein
MSDSEVRIVYGFFEAESGKTRVWVSPIHRFPERAKENLPAFAAIAGWMLGEPVMEPVMEPGV